MVDHRGEIVDGDEILYVLASAWQAKGTLKGGVVGTLMTNLALEHAFEEKGIPFARAGVGDRYVMELLRDKGWSLGGENSGHVICLDRVTTGDAIVAALAVLAVMRESGETLAGLRAGMKLYPQVLINVPVASKVSLDGNEKIEAALKQAETDLAGNGRVLLRPSGTEPLVRVMVEGKVANDVQEICQRVATAVGDALD